MWATLNSCVSPSIVDKPSVPSGRSWQVAHVKVIASTALFEKNVPPLVCAVVPTSLSGRIGFGG